MERFCGLHGRWRACVHKVVVAIIAVAAGCGSLGALLQQEYPVALALHLLSAFCSILAAGAPYFRNAYALLTALGVPCIGGVLVALHNHDCHIASRRNIARDYGDYIDASQRLGDYLQPEPEMKFRPDPDALESMADILRSSAPARDKRLAIEALAQMESPQSVQVLRSVLTASSIEVRFYAASVLANLEQRLSERLARLEQDIATGRRAGPDAVMSLAQSYFDYAYYGLAEGSRAVDFLNRALQRLDEIRDTGIRARVLLLEGRILLRLGRCREAEICFSRYLKISSAKQPGFLWRAEARMFRGDYRGVEADCRAARDAGEIPQRLAEAVDAWLATSNLQQGAS